MNTTELLASVEEEITRLQQVKSLLIGGGGGIPSPFAQTVRKRRFYSAEARARIAAAQKKRWAAQKKAAKKAA